LPVFLTLLSQICLGSPYQVICLHEILQPTFRMYFLSFLHDTSTAPYNFFHFNHHNR
jgi:hypothetical protein